MSDNEDDQPKVVEVPEEPGKRFFISHMNSYTGRVLLEELKNAHKVREEYAAHTFQGTIQEGSSSWYTIKSDQPPEGVEKIVKMQRTREFRESILDSDVIIYDLMTNEFEEVDYVIKTLKTSKLTSEKTLIILSSVMTWVNTPPKLQVEGQEPEAGEGEGGEGAEPEEEEEEEPEEGENPEPEGEEDENKPKPPKVLFFKESDSHLRVPHERFILHKNLETLALSAPKTQPMLKVHVLCAGIRYGHGEGVFYDHFKKAWIQTPSQLTIIGKGDNFIPTIHIRDLSRVTKKIIDDKITKEYIFCVDRTKKPTQKRIVSSISNGIGTGLVKNIQKDEISDSIIWKDFLSINLKMKTSDAFKDKEPPEGEEEEADASKFKFPWHCEKGIVEKAKELNIEFNEARDLNPVKIFVTGPPASGKTFYSDLINGYYNIPRVSVKELSDKAFKMSKTEEEEGLAAEIKAKLDEMKDAAVAKIEEERAEKDYGDEEPPEIDRDALPIRVPDDIIYKLMILRLNENDCRNRGYILDGFPRSYEDCQHIFLKKEKKFDEEGNEMEDEEPELEEGQKKSFKGYIKEDSIFPSSAIVFNQEDKFLMERVMNLSEEQIAGTHYNVTDMKRRLKAYRATNESQIAEPSVQAFFKEHSVQLFERDAAAEKETVFNSLKIYIERFGKPNNYQSFDEDLEARRRIQVEQKIRESAEEQKKREVTENGVERELRKQKEKHTKANMQAIREDQKEQLDQKSQPIRQYLMDNLVPFLTDGLIDICKTQPADPVDALAEYLFKRSLEVPNPDPCTYIE